DGGGDAEAEAAADGDGQLSLFTAISAVPLDEQGRPLDGVRVYDAEADAIPDLVGAPGGGPTVDDTALPLLVDAVGGAAPVPFPDPEPPPAAPAKPSPMARRRQLREQNSAAVA